MTNDWIEDPRAKEIYEACPFCGGENYFGPEIEEREEDPGGKILIRYECNECGESWFYWYTHFETCWKDVNEAMVEQLRKKGKVVSSSDKWQ